MIVKLLNKIGLYTAGQYVALNLYMNVLEKRNRKLVSELYETEKVAQNLREELKKVKKENESLKLKIAKSVKRRRR